ncbi:MAG: nitrogenase component 1 [Phascolarctobacterium sp.]|nr:nitrogenase component 1 [Phascolarctobacterium sp.]
MSLVRYLPNPSDRMGIIWTLLNVEDAIVLEYGPAGTTHYSMGLYGGLGITVNNKLFTTHMSEDDVIMGDVTRLEESLIEIDKAYNPKVIFVVASSIAAIIGSDLKGVCNYMQDEVKARLITFEGGGFRGDYSQGTHEAYKLIVKNLVKATEEKENTYNIIGASSYSYRMASDVWEIQNLLSETFGMKMHACLCLKTNADKIKTMSAAKLNIVLSNQGLSAAEYLKEKFGIPYVYAAPYGYSATAKFLEDIADVLQVKPNSGVIMRLKGKASGIAGLGMMAMMMGKRKKQIACIKGEYDNVRGLSAFLEEAHIDVPVQVSTHSIAQVEDAGNVKHYADEKEWLELFANAKDALIFADDIALMQADESNTKVTFSSPFLKSTQRATHLPFMGEKGADYLLEIIESYYNR